MTFSHIPVLYKQIIKELEIKPDGIYVDTTIGLGGHAKEILKYLDDGKLYGFDQDQIALNIVKKNNYKNLILINGNFVDLEFELNSLDVYKINGILFDLGVSSMQLDDGIRGFSYHKDFDLDMRMDVRNKTSAQTIINNYTYGQLAKVFFEYGNVKHVKRIVNNIIKSREKKEIRTTLELVNIIKSSYSQKELKKPKHPARLVFQALRIETNNEIKILRSSLEQATKLLKINGRLLVISYHSLEDRIVKHFFNNLCTDPNKEIYDQIPIKNDYKSKFKIITKKPIVPSTKEILNNPRARSAKLRIIQRILN